MLIQHYTIVSSVIAIHVIYLLCTYDNQLVLSSVRQNFQLRAGADFLPVPAYTDIISDMSFLTRYQFLGVIDKILDGQTR